MIATAKGVKEQKKHQSTGSAVMVIGGEGPNATNTADCIATQCRAVAGTTSEWPTGEQEKTISQR